MSLDRIFELIDNSDGTVAGSLWAEFRLDSPLVSLPLDREAAGLVIARSTLTIRTRHREDVDINDRLRDADGRIWYVNEAQELGRRRWLDLSLTNYQTVSDGGGEGDGGGDMGGDTTPGDAPVILVADAQMGWAGVLYPNGNSVSRLTVATAVQSDIGDREHHGTFAAIDGVTGSLPTTNSGFRSWPGFGRVIWGRITATNQICRWLPWPRTGTVADAAYTAYGELLVYQDTGPENSTFIADNTFNLLAGATVDLLTAADAAAYVGSF